MNRVPQSRRAGLALYSRRVGLAAAAAVLAAAAIAASAAAGGIGTASGAGIETSSVPSSITQVGSNVIIRGTATGTLTGTLNGSISETFFFLTQADGHIVYTSNGTFTGTVGTCGATTVDYVTVFVGTVTAYTGHFASTGARGGASFEAEFSGSGPVLSYTGTYHC
jgi:hypothetical protein